MQCHLLSLSTSPAFSIDMHHLHISVEFWFDLPLEGQHNILHFQYNVSKNTTPVRKTPTFRVNELDNFHVIKTHRELFWTMQVAWPKF